MCNQNISPIQNHTCSKCPSPASKHTHSLFGKARHHAVDCIADVLQLIDVKKVMTKNFTHVIVSHNDKFWPLLCKVKMAHSLKKAITSKVNNKQSIQMKFLENVDKQKS